MHLKYFVFIPFCICFIWFYFCVIAKVKEGKVNFFVCVNLVIISFLVFFSCFFSFLFVLSNTVFFFIFYISCFLSSVVLFYERCIVDTFSSLSPRKSKLINVFLNIPTFLFFSFICISWFYYCFFYYYIIYTYSLIIVFL